MISSSDILDLGEYERARDKIRAGALAARALRRVEVGPNLAVNFENRETVRYQIQEMLRAERIAKPEGVAHEIETYSELLPAPTELSATMLIEFPEATERARRLVEMVGLERHVFLELGGRRFPARFDERQLDPEKVSAVQFIRFPLAPEAGALLAPAAPGPKRLVVDHPAYTHAAELGPEVCAALARDLAEAAR